MEFILAQLSMLMWLSLISVILAEFPVQQLKILISGGTGSAVFFLFFFFRSKEATAILHVFWVYAKRFLQQHSIGAAMANIVKCPANTLPPLRARTNTQTHVQEKTKQKKTKKNASPFFSILAHFFPFFFFLAITQWQCARGEESALICQSEQPFHRASLHSASVPEWELLISPGRLACSRVLGSPPLERDRRREGAQESGPRSGLGRRQIRAPHAAPACTYHCLLELSLSLSLSSTHSYGHTHSFSCAHVRH